MPESARYHCLPRRTVLAGATLAAPALRIRGATATERCVVGTWGGDYARLLRENIDDPILRPLGIDVVQDVGDETPRYAKLSKLPRGTQDIAYFGAVNDYRAGVAGLVDVLDESKVPISGTCCRICACPALRRISTARR
jgi:putative spermidine/putrescine transport system substrate-binding protein